jgi:fibronectin-binding autotransporter adhesin
MRRHSWGKSIGSRRGTAPFGLGPGRRGSPIGRKLLSEGVSLAALGIAAGAIGALGVMSSAAGAATLNLNGLTVTLPDGVVFTTPFLTGENSVTNNPVSPATGTLIEGGGPAGTTYSGVISDGTSPTAWTHTGGEVTITGTNTYTGATTIAGGTVIGGATNAFSAASATTVNAGGTLDLGGFNQTVSSLAGAGIVTNYGPSVATLTNQGASSTFSGVIEDDANQTALTHNSAGNTLTLTGTNTYSGGTTISAGTLQLGNGGTSGSIAGDVVDNGTLAFNRSDAIIFSGTITGTGGIAQIGTGTTTLTTGDLGPNTYSGATTITRGTLALTGGGSIANSSVLVGAGASFDISQSEFASIAALSGAGTVALGAQSLTITGPTSSTFSGVIQDGGKVGSLIVAGGTQTLSGINTYTGQTFITGATLALSGAGSISGSSVALGGNFDISKTTAGASIVSLSDCNDSINCINGTSPFATVLLGSKTLTIIEEGRNPGEPPTPVTFSGNITDQTLDDKGEPTGPHLGGGLTLMKGEMDATGTFSFTGTTTIGDTMGDSARLNVSDFALPGGPIVVDQGGTLDLSAIGSFPGAQITIASLSGSGTVLLGGGMLTISTPGVFDGSIQDGGNSGGTGAGVDVPAGKLQQLGGQNVFSGSTVIEDGATLQILRNGSFADCFSGLCPTPDQYSGAIQIGSGGTFEYSSTFAQTLGGVISGLGSLVKDVSSSTLTLTPLAGPNTNTYTGGTAVSAGTLLGGSANAFSAASPTTIFAGGTVNLGGFAQTINTVLLAGGTITGGTLTRAISSSGGLVSEIDGPMSLTTTSGTTTLINTSYTGATTIAGGVLQLGNGTTILGNITDNGTLAFDRTDTFTFANVISGTGALAQVGPGTTILTGDNMYTGGTMVSNGVLELSGAGTLGLTSGSVTVSGGILNLGGTTQRQDGGVTLSGGGTIENGTLLSSSGISSSGGTIDGILGGTNLTTTAGVTTLLGTNVFGTVTNRATLINEGDTTDVLNNSGTVTNIDIYNAIVANNTGLITNKGTWNGTGNNTGGSIDNQVLWNGDIINTAGTFKNEGTVAGGVTNSGTFTTTGVVTGGLTNASSGTVTAQGTISGDIQNFSLSPPNFGSIARARGFNLTGNVSSDGVFNNSGTVRVDPSQTNVTLAVKTFVNNGELDLRNPTTVATNLTIKGNYVAQDPPLIDLNVLATALNTGQQQANHLAITGVATGATNVSVQALNGMITIFPNSIPIISVGPGSTATFTALPSQTNLGSLVAFGIEQTSPTQWDLTSHINPVPIGSIAGSISSAVTSVATGFFQGSTAFLGAPATATPNQIDSGVWTRGATGMNNERSVVTASLEPGAPSDLKTETHFSGYQVGSDVGMFNIQNTGWNLHAGITGGEYAAESSEANFSDGFSSFTVPFLGVYAAATGHGFFADVLVRHDFWRGEVTSAGALLTNAQMDGHGNAVTAEAGYTYHFQNGIFNGIFNGVFVTPSIGFSYTNANFQQLNLLPGSLVPPTLNLGAVVSDLGRFGATLGDTFATTYWALTPNVNVSVWHEFAGAIPSVFTSAQPGQPILTDNVSETRIGTFGQFGIGLTAQPIQNPNWTLFARADWRTGSDIYGGTVTAGFRYQF